MGTFDPHYAQDSSHKINLTEEGELVQNRRYTTTMSDSIEFANV